MAPRVSCVPRRSSVSLSLHTRFCKAHCHTPAEASRRTSRPRASTRRFRRCARSLTIPRWAEAAMRSRLCWILMRTWAGHVFRMSRLGRRCQVLCKAAAPSNGINDCLVKTKPKKCNGRERIKRRIERENGRSHMRRSNDFPPSSGGQATHSCRRVAECHPCTGLHTPICMQSLFSVYCCSPLYPTTATVPHTRKALLGKEYANQNRREDSIFQGLLYDLTCGFFFFILHGLWDQAAFSFQGCDIQGGYLSILFIIFNYFCCLC